MNGFELSTQWLYFSCVAMLVYFTGRRFTGERVEKHLREQDSYYV